MKKATKKALSKQATRTSVANKAKRTVTIEATFVDYSEDLAYYHTLANEASLEHSMGGNDYTQTNWR